MLSISCVFLAALLLLGPSPTTALKNKTLDREIDIQLFRIQNAVKSRDFPGFQGNFHEEFDSRAWFNRYYSQLTDSQLSTFTLRRFASVEESGAGSYKFKYSESRSNGADYLLLSFLATTKPSGGNPYAIWELKRFGEYKRKGIQ